MARLRKRRVEGPSAEDRAEALDRARAMTWYGLAGEVDPPWSREEVESMGPAELRKLLAARPELPTRAVVSEALEVAEGRRLATHFWERQAEVGGS